MAISEIARERKNIKGIINRGEARNIHFEGYGDINSMSLDELKNLHRNIYDYASAVTETGEKLTGQDVKKFENKNRTAVARGEVQEKFIDYDYDMSEPEDTYDDNSDNYEYENEPDYDDDTPDYSYDDGDRDFSDDVMDEELTCDDVIDQMRELAGEFSGEAVDALNNEISKAIANLGYHQVAKNIIANRDKFLDSAIAVAKYWNRQGKTAQNTRLSNYQAFLSILYADGEDNHVDTAEKIASSGTTVYNTLTKATPPDKALKFTSKQQGLDAGYQRFWYGNDSEGYTYYDSRSKKK